MLGFASVSVFLACIAATIFCVIYGILKWNKE
ncbi:MAG: symporter small accessory protein [Candidatus Humimicrobiaceae bacterium]